MKGDVTMKATTRYQSERAVTVDIIGLQTFTGLGKQSARQIAEAAGAVLSVGRRKMYYLPKVERYLESLTEQGR